MKSPSIDTSGTEAAQRAVAEAQAQATNLQKNFATDLKTENLTQVKAAGSADSMEPDTGTARKRRTGTGLASQLGINV